MIFSDFFHYFLQFSTPKWAKMGRNASKSIPNPPKNDHKTNKQNLLFGTLPDWFLEDLGSQKGRKQFNFWSLLGSWSRLGAKKPPRPPQRPPRSLQEASWDEFWTIVGAFLIHLLFIFLYYFLTSERSYFVFIMFWSMGVMGVIKEYFFSNTDTIFSKRNAEIRFC